MKIQLIVAAGFVALATGANAQVITAGNIITPFDGVSAKFLSIGENLSDIDGSIDVSVGGQNGSTNEEIGAGFTTLQDSTAATTATFGDMATTAAGALSNTTTDLSETAAEFNSAADAATSNTTSAAADIASVGGGIGVSTGAFNSGLIDGSITVDVEAGNTMIGSLSTTAAGAINTANITAAFVSLAAQ